jgi:hypothetical protein
VDIWAGTSDSVPANVVAPFRAGSDGTSTISYSENVWEWFGVIVPVERDFWSGHALKTAMRFLLWKYGRGGPVGLRVSSWCESLMLERWMRGFGVTHTVLEFDEEMRCCGFRTVKTVSLGMFVWAVRCGIWARTIYVSIWGGLDRCCSIWWDCATVLVWWMLLLLAL